MAKEGGTVRVCGLPLDINKNRLIDKLHIHFLRKRNGGGDISSVTVSKTTPGSAFITFEDSEVARRVVEHQNHTLSVNGKQYELSVSLHSKDVDPDELFVDTAVTVDYSKLNGGKTSISNILKNACDIKCTFHVQADLCTFKGRYTEVQILTKCLLRLFNSQTSKDVHSLKAEATEDDKRYNSAQGRTERQEDTETSGQANGLDLGNGSSRASESNRALLQESYTNDRKGADALYTSYTNHREEAGALHTSYTNDIEDAVALEKGTSMEDFSMVIDSDIFRYLRKYCSAEYQNILDRHGVEILDVTTRDITTLYLQLKAGATGRGVEHLRLAHGELAWLYQDKEAQLRKEQLAKESFPRLGLQQAFKTLTQRFTKLLINEDKSNVYLVGSGSDVSEAKQFLLEMQGTTKEHGQELLHSSGDASLPFVPDTKLRKERAVRSKEFKMAATFGRTMGSEKPKDDENWSSLSDVKAPEDHQINSFSSTKLIRMNDQKLGSGPISGITSQKVEISSSGPRDLQEDTLFKRYEPLSTASLSVKPPLNLAQNNETRPTKAANFSEFQGYSMDDMDMSVDRAVPTGVVQQSKSISTLRRSNSFSGQVRTKQVRKDSSSAVDLFGKTKGGETTSHPETRQVFSVELVVPTTQWLYTKDVFRILLEEVTSDLQMKEKKTLNEVVLHLRGKDPANVRVCQQVLKKLIDKVAEDFSTHELLLTQLGVSDSKNETVEVLCTTVRETWEKVKIIPMPNTKSILIFGPKLDCLEVMSFLKEVLHFGTEGEQTMKERPIDLKKPSSDSPSNPDINSSAAHQSSASSDKQDQETTPATDIVSSGSLEGVSQSGVKKVPVLKLRLGAAGPVDEKSFRTISAPYKAEGSLRVTEGNDAAPLPEHSAQRLTGPKPEKSQIPNSRGLQTQKNHSEGNAGLSCICGTAGASVSWTAGGKAMCPSCVECTKSHAMNPQSATAKHYGASRSNEKQDVKDTEVKASPSCVGGTTGESVSMTACGGALCQNHIHPDCKVRPKSKEGVVGIRGTMTRSEMSISLVGYNKDTTLKITYNIPDGIQGKDHPNPGGSFQGGTFHAFLPLNETTLKLLPCLERAFHRGLTFNVRVGDTRDCVTWGSIPHKTSIEGGFSRNGYPDSRYLRCLAEALRSHGIEEG
ncbi:uncharacterized protein LOC120046288 [Salvelinus namaycush]|uniref:RING-type E3 ubiquitin transferase n=1 Tax=Salvelinus namaycush TaxID=8040 RepID=A0A8U0QQ65_SALNM|nr:uncharacterized protein LOC120046288 [Salvelinus namaycush]